MRVFVPLAHNPHFLHQQIKSIVDRGVKPAIPVLDAEYMCFDIITKLRTEDQAGGIRNSDSE